MSTPGGPVTAESVLDGKEGVLLGDLRRYAEALTAQGVPDGAAVTPLINGPDGRLNFGDTLRAFDGLRVVFDIGPRPEPPPLTPDQWVQRVRGLLDDLHALGEHPGVGVSGLTTEALWDASEAVHKVLAEIAAYPPVRTDL